MTSRLRGRHYLGLTTKFCAGRRLRGGYLCMMRMAQHLESAQAIAIWAKVVMTAGGVALAIAWQEMVDLAVAPSGGALWSNTAKLGASFGGRARKTPHMFALPRPTTFLRAPSPSARLGEGLVAPLASSMFARPPRKRTRNPLKYQRRNVLTHLSKNNTCS